VRRTAQRRGETDQVCFEQVEKTSAIEKPERVYRDVVESKLRIGFGGWEEETYHSEAEKWVSDSRFAKGSVRFFLILR